MKNANLPKSFFKGNRQKISRELKPNSVAIVSSNDKLNRNGDQDFPFRQSSDLFYLTGLNQEKCILTLCPSHPDKNLREVLFTVKPNEKQETWTGHKFTKEEIQKVSGIASVKWLDDFEMTMRDLVLSSENIYINLNEYSKYQSDVAYIENRLAQKLKGQYPAHQFHRLAPIITKLRLVKRKEEIELLKAACSITNQAFQRVLKFAKAGIMEYEVEAEITHEFLRNGARGHAYQPIVGSGKNALILHYIENSNKCGNNELLLMDFGAEYGNYAADCTRTIPVNGKFTNRQKQCYEAVLRVQKKSIKLYTPGNTIDKINKATWKMMEEEMIGLGLFTKKDVKSQNEDQPLYTKYLMHGIAHFIGLDVHDVGSKYEKLKKGMVLTCEPGLYINEEGIGIRIENDIVVDDTPFDLMQDIPREIEEIEDLMIR
ncbi:MAG: M24 family metallopeptidase [Chlorobi bacterium]|nr:M24 family metallopeptidase [Chlorobiota bacterium]